MFDCRYCMLTYVNDNYSHNAIFKTLEVSRKHWYRTEQFIQYGEIIFLKSRRTCCRFQMFLQNENLANTK